MDSEKDECEERKDGDSLSIKIYGLSMSLSLRTRDVEEGESRCIKNGESDQFLCSLILVDFIVVSARKYQEQVRIGFLYPLDTRVT